MWATVEAADIYAEETPPDDDHRVGFGTDGHQRRRLDDFGQVQRLRREHRHSTQRPNPSLSDRQQGRSQAWFSVHGAQRNQERGRHVRDQSRQRWKRRSRPAVVQIAAGLKRRPTDGAAWGSARIIATARSHSEFARRVLQASALPYRLPRSRFPQRSEDRCGFERLLQRDNVVSHFLAGEAGYLTLEDGNPNAPSSRPGLDWNCNLHKLTRGLSGRSQQPN